MINTGIESVGDFCYVFRQNLDHDFLRNAVENMSKKTDMDQNLYSVIEI